EPGRAHEVIGLVDRVVGGRRGPGEVIRARPQAGSLGTGPVRQVVFVDEVVVLAGLDDRELLPGRGDIRPGDRALPVAHVDAFENGGRTRGGGRPGPGRGRGGAR